MPCKLEVVTEVSGKVLTIARYHLADGTGRVLPSGVPALCHGDVVMVEDQRYVVDHSELILPGGQLDPVQRVFVVQC